MHTHHAVSLLRPTTIAIVAALAMAPSAPAGARDMLRIDRSGSATIATTLSPALRDEVLKASLPNPARTGAAATKSAVPLGSRQQWPAWATVSIAGDAGEVRCSATMVDAFHAVTATSCLESMAGSWELIDVTSIEAGPSGMIVSDSIDALWAYPTYVEDGYEPNDVSFVRFKEAFGAATGDFGFGEASCGWLMGASLQAHAWDPFDHEDVSLERWNGDVDTCPQWWEVRVADLFGFQAGAAIASDDGVIRAIGTHLDESYWNEGQLTGLDSVRWREAFSEDLAAIMADARPDTPDLVVTGLENKSFGAVGFDLDEEGVLPDGKVDLGRVWVHNYSDADYAGPVTVEVRASNDGDDDPGAGDRVLWSKSLGHRQIGAQQNLLVDVPKLPVAAFFPDAEHRAVRVAARVIAANEASDTNNWTLSRRVEAESPIVDLAVVDVTPFGGTFLPSQSVRVDLAVANLGLGASSQTAATFRLHRLKYVVSGPSFTGDPPLTIGNGIAPALVPGADWSSTVHVPLAQVPPGDYQLEVVLAAANGEPAAALGNNAVRLPKDALQSRIRVADTDVFAPMQDIRVDYFGTPANASLNAGQSLQASFSVTTLGGPSQSWQARFWARNEATGQWVHLATGQWGPLATGASYAGVEQVPIDALGLGVWRMWVHVTSVEPDTNTSNNIRASGSTFTVHAGGLIGG